MIDRQRERIRSRAGTLLILIALLTGMAIANFTNPHQALAALVVYGLRRGEAE